MMNISGKSQAGFTLVELLVTIVVIAILASISVASYSGIQQRAHNAAQASDMNNVIKSMEIYSTINGSYPPAPASSIRGFCVGTGYPDGYCFDSDYELHSFPESDRTITDALATVVSVPNHKRNSVHGLSGPFVNVFSETHYRVNGVFYGETCEGFSAGWNDPDIDRIICYKDLHL